MTARNSLFDKLYLHKTHKISFKLDPFKSVFIQIISHWKSSEKQFSVQHNKLPDIFKKF